MTFAKVSFDSKLVIFGLPMLVVAFCVLVSFSALVTVHPELAIGITYDLTLTAPLLYLFLIRKQNISKFTVIPFFVVCILIGKLILPEESRFHLDLMMKWVLPIVELVAFTVISFAAYRTYTSYKSVSGKSSDAMEIIRETCTAANFPAFFAKIAAFEIGAIYYAFWAWRAPRRDNTYSYHKKSGIVAVYSIVIFIILAETLVIHVLVVGFSQIIAWLLTISSVYLAFQIFAHLKAAIQRPFEFLGTKLFLHNGLFNDIVLEAENIKSFEATSLPFEKEAGVKKFGLVADIEQHNFKIELNEETELTGFYGIGSKVKTLYVFVDEVDAFKEAIQNFRQNSKNGRTENEN